MKIILNLILIAIPFLGFTQDVIPYKSAIRISEKGKIGKQKIKGFGHKDWTVFFIVRHAEKDTTGTYADLNPIGRGRALELVNIFKKVKIDGVYSTDRPRTKNTGVPIATDKNLTTELYDAKLQKELLEKLAQQKGKHFFIVGHSNTVPQIVNILRGSDEEKEFSESDYTRLYIVSVKKIGDAKMQLIRF